MFTSHLYRKASRDDKLSSLMLYDVGFHTTRGGGSETDESKSWQLTASEQKQIRFVCFLCLLNIHDDQATPMEMHRIENEKKQQCERCQMQGISNIPEGIFETQLSSVLDQPVSASRKLWCLDKIALRDKSVMVYEREEYRCFLPAEIQTHSLLKLIEKTYFKVNTNGNGKCGIHAPFGEPCAQQELKLGDSEAFIRSALRPSLQELRSILSDLEGQ